MSSRSKTRVYCGNLPPDVRRSELEKLFDKYGVIANIDLKSGRSGPPFAFIEFEDSRDASDAVNARDGYNYDGYTLRVEYPRGDGGSRGGRSYGGGGGGGHGGGYGGGGGGGGGGGRGFGGGRGGFGASRRSEYRVLVSGLPPSGSWQDLKDHMREAGDVCYADVYKDGTGVVEYLRRDDMNYAFRKLDDTRFRSHEGETSYIRVKPDYRGYKDNSRSRSRSRSHSPQRRRSSPRYSPVHRSRSRS